MNEIRKTHAESIGARSYVSPLSKVVQFQPEGMLCISNFGVGTQKFKEEDFSNGSFWD